MSAGLHEPVVGITAQTAQMRFCRGDHCVNPVYVAAWILMTISGLAAWVLIGWGLWTLVRGSAGHA